MPMGYDLFIYKNYTKYISPDRTITWLINIYIRNDSIICLM